MDAMVRPVTLTSLTTMVGFLSFLFAPIPPVSYFGVFAALGIAFCWLWSLVAMPAALTLLGADRLRHPGGRRLRGDAAGRLVDRGFAWLMRRPRVTLAALAVATLLLSLGTIDLFVQDSWIDGFASGSRMRVDSERVDAALNGTHVLLAAIEWPGESGRWPRTRRGEGPLLAPEALRAIGRFEDGLRRIPGVGGVLGPDAHLRTVHFLFMAGRAGSRSIPETAERVSHVLDRFDQARGAARRREVFHDDLHRAVVTLLVKNANYRDTARIMQRARSLAEQHLAPLGAELTFGGDLAVSQAMIPAIVETQLGSLFIALLGAALAVAWLSGSRRVALLALAPTALALLWLMGALGHLAIPIGVATSTFCAITLGVGVDYAVHLLEGIRRLGSDPGDLCALGPAARLERVSRAVREVAPAVVADASAVSLGFGVLAFSQVPANARLGVSIGVALVASALLTLLGLAAFLLVWPRHGSASSAAAHAKVSSR
jgi:predicted RND superfamily exporter protein